MRRSAANHKCGILDVQEEFHRFKIFNHPFWRATVKVVNEYYKSLEVSFFNKCLEVISKRTNIMYYFLSFFEVIA